MVSDRAVFFRRIVFLASFFLIPVLFFLASSMFRNGFRVFAFFPFLSYNTKTVDLRNPSSSPATVSFRFYAPDGSLVGQTASVTIQPRRHTTLPFPSSLPSSFLGSVHLVSDSSDVVVTSNTTVTSLPDTAQYRGMQPAKSLFLPHVACNRDNLSTWFAIYNSEGVETNLYVFYNSNLRYPRVLTKDYEFLTIPAHGMIVVNPQTSVCQTTPEGIGGSFVGAVRINGLYSPLSAAVYQVGYDTFRSYSAFGFSDGQQTLRLSTIDEQTRRAVLSVAVQNLGKAATDILFRRICRPEVLRPFIREEHDVGPDHSVIFSMEPGYVPRVECDTLQITNSRNMPLAAVVVETQR